jgi:acyl dehydratase
MPIKEIYSIDELRALTGQEVSTSDWLEVTQERINLFADATGDHQWIHSTSNALRPNRPTAQPSRTAFSPCRCCSFLMKSAVEFKMPTKLGINYGLNRVRFVSAVPAGSRIRARVALQNLEDFAGGHQFTWLFTVEIEGTQKPACVAEWLTRIYV